MTRLLVEDVFLLAHDDESGKNTASIGLQGALARALLLDLAEQGLVTVVDDHVHVAGAGTDDPLLARAAAVIRDEPKPAEVGHWLGALPGTLTPFGRTVGEALVARGVLGEQEGQVLGLFGTTRWPERDPQPEQELRAEVRGAPRRDRADDARPAAVRCSAPTACSTDASTSPSARRRASAPKRVRATRAAMMTAVIASITAATVGAVAGSN